MSGSRKDLLTPEWEKLGDPVAQDIMLNGLKLFFHTDPTLSSDPPPHAVTSSKQVKNMLPFIPEWLERGYVRELSKQEARETPLFYSRTFTVPKKEGKRRPVLDLSELNKLLRIPKFRMETLDRIVENIVEGLWGASLDAYLNVPLAPEFHKFFAFVLGERTFVFQVLPFGLSTAPWAFTRVIKPIKAHLRQQGVSVASFFDDFLILVGSQQLTRDHTQMTQELLESLGFRINLSKSSFTPQRSLEFLGVVLNLADLTLSLPQSKVDKILRWVGEGGEREFFSRRDLESLVGFLNFTASYLPLGRLYLIPIMVWMNFHTAVESRDLLVPIDEELRSALIPWTDLEALRNPVPMHTETPSVDIMTDASAYGWGGVMIPFQVRGTWGPSLEGFSMNWKELRAIFLTLSYFVDQLQGRTVRVLSDNTTAIACLRRQGSLVCPFLWNLTREILEMCQERSITLVPVHLRGVLNILADGLSRNTLSTEWCLDRQTFVWICQLLGWPVVDLFGTRYNNQLPRFVSPYPDPLAVGWDAFSLEWEEFQSVYVFPPIQVLPEVVFRLSSYPGSGFLIAPYWPTAGWFQLLAARCPRAFPLRQGHSLHQRTREGLQEYPRVAFLNLHVWIL